jgi:hypothetical protein
MSSNRERLGIVGIISVIASCIGIFVFSTGIQSLGELLNPARVSTISPPRVERDTSENPNQSYSSAPIGVYNVDLTLETTSSIFKTRIKSIEVLDNAEMKITIAVFYNTNESIRLFCDMSGDFPKPFITLTDGTIHFPLPGQAFCDINPTWASWPKFGEIIEFSDVFPLVPDATQPFSYTNQSFGKLDGIRLIK